MSWLRAVYALVTLSTTGLSIWGALLVWHRRAVPGGLPFFGLLAALAAWNLAAALEALSYTAAQQMFWARFQYLGLTLLAPSFVLFVMEYLRLIPRWGRYNWLLFLFPVATILAAWTNQWHHWLWAQTIFDPATQTTTYLRGPWFLANTLYIYGLTFCGSVPLLWMAIHLNRLYRLQMLAVVTAVFLPLAASLAYLFPHLTIAGFDPMPSFFALSGILLLLALFRFQLLDLQPIASNILLNTLQEAILVIDQQQRLVEMNAAAELLLGMPLHKAIGLPADHLAAGFPELAARLHSPAHPSNTVIRHPDGRWFDVRTAQLNDRLGSTGKQLISLYDTSAAKQAEADLAHQTADLKAVAEISLAIATNLDRSHIARTIVDLTRQHFLYYAAQIFLLDADGQTLILTATSGPNQPDESKAATWEGARININQEKSLIARVARQRSGLIVNDVLTEATFLPYPLYPDTRAEMPAPIIFGDQLVGVLDVQNDCPNSFSQQDLDILMTLAAQSAVALQNARYFDQLIERQIQLSLLNEISHSASASTELDGLLRTVAGQMGQLIDADDCYITLWDEQRQQPIPAASSGVDGHSRSIQRLPGEPGLTETVLRTGQWLAVPDVHQAPSASLCAADHLPTHSVLALPLLAGEKKYGAALICFNSAHPFTPAEISICEQAAGQLSLAIAKTYALEEAQRQAREAEILQQAGAAVAATLNKDEAIQRILEQVHRIIPYDSASVALLQDEQTLEIVGGYGFSDLQTVIGIRFHLDETTPSTLVVQTRQPVIIADAQAQYEAFRQPPHNHIRGWLGVPLIVKDRVIGMIAIDSLQIGAFSPQHSRLAVAISDQVAIALENARLFEDTQRLAITDSLTGLYNRRHFFILARREFERSLRYKGPLSTVMIDLDHFKRINDTFGHHVGDQVLQMITCLCRQSFRQTDTIGRYGGEEFVILMPETNLEQAYQGAERLRQLISQTPIPTQAGPVLVTISLGVHSFVPETGYAGTIDSEIEKLIDRADQALLVSKHSGRNRVTIWSHPDVY